MGDIRGMADKSISLPFDISLDITLLHPSELRMEMESAIEDVEDIIVRMQMLEPERMMEQYRQSINETASESAKTVKNGVLNIFSKILTNVLNEDVAEEEAPPFAVTYKGQNPLMIDLVVRHVMEYLSIQDLRSCRLVCRLWNMEAGAHARRKQRIVFSPNCIEKMASFTAFMKAQFNSEEEEEGSSSSREVRRRDISNEEKNDNHPHYWSPPSKDNNNGQNSSDYARALPPFRDFSFTAQYPRINFSPRIVLDFSQTYGQYVRQLEIFYPNDSSLTAKDFRQFFLNGMPNVEYIHFVNLPTKLTQSSFLRRRNNMRGNTTTTPSGNDSCSDNNSTTNRINNNNRNEKDSNCNDSQDNAGKSLMDNEKFGLVAGESENVDESRYVTLKWTSLSHLKIDRTLLIEVAWSEPFLEDLFSTMPNLRHYELFTWNTTGGDSHSIPYFTCLTAHQRKKLESLYPGSVGSGLLTSLADYGLTSLKKLHLPVFSGEVSAQSVEHLLSQLRGTLTELQINCSSMQDSRMIQFPRMEKLVSLHMIISVPWKNVYTLFTPSIDYSNELPALEILKLELAVYHDFGFIHYFFPGAGSQCKTLRELDISFSGYRDDKFIGIVAKLFPNLIKLRLDGYGNRILANICLYLQNLEYFEMYLIYGFNVDDQLTGIDRKTCAEMRKFENYLDWNELDDAQTSCGGPSLASLTKLKTLKIKQKDYQAKFWPQAQCITDITGYYALGRIKTLRHLLIESVKFSPECRQYLATTLEDCWLDFL